MSEVPIGVVAVGKAKLKWNLQAFREIRRSAEMQAMIEAECERIVDDAGEGFAWDTDQKPNRDRNRGIVFTDTYAGRYEQHKNNTLLKALGS